MKENSWNLSSGVEFDKLARLPQFEGHNRTTLHNIYHRILQATMSKLGKKSKREVTVEQVEEWRNTSTVFNSDSTRQSKNTSLIREGGADC